MYYRLVYASLFISFYPPLLFAPFFGMLRRSRDPGKEPRAVH